MQKISEANRKFWIRNKSTSRNRSFPHHLLTYLLTYLVYLHGLCSWW